MSPVEHRADAAHPHAPLVALGIDVGTTNTKAVLVEIQKDGATGGSTVRELAVRSFPTPRHADAILTGLEDAIRTVLPGDDRRPDVIGIASMAETGVPLDRDERPLTELVRWNGQGDVLGTEIVTESVTAERLFDLTGVPLAPKVPLAMWAALRSRDAALWNRVHRWSGMADLVGLALTGDLVTDHTLAGRTMAYRLPAPGHPLPASFDAELLSLAGLEPANLPRVAAPGDAAGHVNDEAARRFGVPHGTPVYMAGHDHAVGAWAAGVRTPGQSADSIGTTEALVRVVDGPVDRGDVWRAGMSLTRTVAGERESLVAGMAQAGALVGSWSDTALGGGRLEDALAELAASGTGPGSVLVLPYPSGRQTPAPDPAARLEILDADGRPCDPASVSPAELTRGLLTGLGLHLRWMAAEQARLTGGSFPDHIAVLGGAGVADEAWMRLKAAIMPASLERVAAVEPVATGAALLAAVRAGLVSADVRLPASTVHQPVEPPSAEAGYDGAYATFVAAAAGAPTGKGTQ